MAKKNEEKQENIKIILLGEEKVGKTNLINTYFGKDFKEDTQRTLDKSENLQLFEMKNKKYTINIWDTMGTEKYRSMTKNFIRGSHIIIFVYDITRIETFVELEYWITLVNQEISTDKIIFGLVGNKIDLYLEQKVNKQEGLDKAQKLNAEFAETSAKNNPLPFKNLVIKLLGKLFFQKKIIQKPEDIAELKEIKEIKEEKEGKKNQKKKKCC